MKIAPYDSVEPEPVKDATDVTIRWLITKKDGAPNFAMRIFEVGPGGGNQLHTHAWEHEVFIIEGEGYLGTPDEQIPFKAGHFVFVEPNKVHQFRNTGDKPMKFLCMIPNQ
ncbi:MAG: cupin domain-containing protein [Chloroflexi bacterium]|nr:cupin domain-containing protein [Chloroflexota bacterium]